MARPAVQEDAGGTLQPNRKMMIMKIAACALCARHLTAMTQVSRCALPRAGGKMGASPDPELRCTS